MKVKANHKKATKGTAAKLIRETPRAYSSDLSDKKQLKTYMRGEVVFKSAEKTHDSFEDNFKEIQEKAKKRREKVAELDKKFQREMPVEDKIVRAVKRSLRNVTGFLRRKV